MTAKPSVSHAFLGAAGFSHRPDHVGDPQTTVAHLGEVVLFLQHTLARFHVSEPFGGVRIHDEKEIYDSCPLSNFNSKRGR